MTRRLLPAALAALLAAAAAPAAADTGLLEAASAEYGGGQATQEGLVALAFLAGDPATSAIETPWLALDARHAQVTVYESEALDGQAGPYGSGPIPFGPAEPTESTHADLRARLADFQPGFQAHVFSSGEMAYAAKTDRGHLASLGPVRMSEGAFGSDPPAQAQTGSNPATFTSLERAGPLVVHRSAGAHAELALRGDFVLELHGLTLGVASSQGESTLASGTWRTALAGSDAGPASLAQVRTSFVRISVEDGELTLAVDGGDARLDWAASTLDLASDGPVALAQARGLVRAGDRDVRLEGERYVLPAGSLLSLQPRQGAIALGVSEPDLGTRGTIADVPAPASAALVGAGAVLALGLAVAVGLLRRALRRPELADVEAAIEAGEYRRAARQARRILAHRPADESAVLARAIALAKAGEQQRAVRELTAHLARGPASDGSLHYVLGLAQIDLGRHEEGRASLREAVRLTPSLQGEVRARLGKGFSVPTPTSRESSAYA